MSNNTTIYASYFDAPTSRRGTASYKWDSCPDSEVLPLWVADMDFRTAPAIIQALTKRVEHGIFGYVRVPDEYYQATIDWFRRRHGFTMQRQWIIYTSGVVPAISAIIKAMTQSGDAVLVQCPVYNCFFSSIRNNGCRMVTSNLVYEQNTYHIDFSDLEAKASRPDVKVMLLCNPHNPAGRVWTRQELTRIGEICLRHGVFVISDEIHCELVYKPHHYTPFASISHDFLMNSATCTSPSKAFNIAGLQIANITAADDDIRARIDKAININEVCDVNPFGVEALMAAYNHGEQWLRELLKYIHGNYTLAADFFARELPQFPVTRLEGTYLMWIDCSCLALTSEQIVEYLKSHHKVWLNEGEMYGEAGKHFVRLNLACQRSVLTEALTRIASGLLQLLNEGK